MFLGIGRKPENPEVALVNFTDLVFQNMDKSLITGAVFLDLAKALVTVDHSILFAKLSKSGFSDTGVD